WPPACCVCSCREPPSRPAAATGAPPPCTMRRSGNAWPPPPAPRAGTTRTPPLTGDVLGAPTAGRPRLRPLGILVAMSLHIAAEPGQIAPRVLLPGDPLRARWIAENFLENAELYNQVRGMFGFTGSYRGQRVSVQGTGMGQPSLSIYVNELISEYAVQQLVRVGSCGALTDRLGLRDLVIGQAAAT